MIESLYQHFESGKPAKKVADETFLRGDQKQQESVYKQETKEMQISPTAADSLIQAYVQGATNGREALEGSYGFFPDDDCRKKALSSLYPELKDYMPKLGKLENYGVIYQFFIGRIINNIREGAEGDIDGIRDEDGKLDVSKLQTKIEQAAEAVKFIKSDEQRMGLHALIRAHIIDIFNNPESVKKWQPFIDSLSSEAQAGLLQDVISFSDDFKKIPPQAPEALQEWVKVTSWADSEEKVDLIEAARAWRNIDALNSWKPVIERIGRGIQAIRGAEGGREGIKKGEAAELFKEIAGFIRNRIDSQPPLTPEKALERWEGLLKHGAQ